MMNDVIERVKNYFIKQIGPIIGEQYNDYICCIGGSYSYGYADEKSDIDVYIIGDISRDFILPKNG